MRLCPLQCSLLAAHQAPKSVMQEEKDHVVLGEELCDRCELIGTDLHL